MSTPSLFTVAYCQATLFTPDEEVSAAKIVAGLLPQWTPTFDGEPVVLPLPGLVPREVPRVILQSKTEAWRCEISSARINLFWRRTKDDDRSLALSDFFQQAVSRLLEYQDFQRARVGRLAAVISRFREMDAPAVYLARHFCQARWLTAPLNRPEALELHAHKRYEHGGVRLNSWVRNKTAEIAGPEGAPTRPILLVEQDLNTLPEEESTASYDPDSIKKFFAVVSGEFDHILNLYYPSED